MPYSIQPTRIEGVGELCLCTEMDNQRSKHKLILAILQKSQASIADHEKVKLENYEHFVIDSNRGTPEVFAWLLRYNICV